MRTVNVLGVSWEDHFERVLAPSRHVEHHVAVADVLAFLAANARARGCRSPDPSARLLLKIIEQDPEAVERAAKAA